MQFHNEQLQAEWDEYQAMMASPEFIAKQKARLIEARKEFWKSSLFWICGVMSPGSNLALMWVLVKVFHAEPDPIVWIAAVGLPVLIATALYPRN